MVWLDINVNVNMSESEINGLFNQLEEMKRQRQVLKDQIDVKTEKIIQHIIDHGNVLAYKNDVPHILTIGSRFTNKFNKAQLASDTGTSEKELNYVGVAELVEVKTVTSEKLKSYYQEEPKRVLKARKAKKSDLELLRNRGRI